jgi:acetyl esterase/lipase
MSETVQPRVADVRLRGLLARAYWPRPTASAPALVIFPYPAEQDADAACRRLCSATGVVVLAVAHKGLADAMTALEWAASHARDLDADPDQLFVTGDLADAVARQARENGWPPVRVLDRQSF